MGQGRFAHGPMWKLNKESTWWDYSFNGLTTNMSTDLRMAQYSQCFPQSSNSSTDVKGLREKVQNNHSYVMISCRCCRILFNIKTSRNNVNLIQIFVTVISISLAIKSDSVEWIWVSKLGTPTQKCKKFHCLYSIPIMQLPDWRALKYTSMASSNFPQELNPLGPISQWHRLVSLDWSRMEWRFYAAP